MSKRIEIAGDWVDAAMASFGLLFGSMVFGVSLWHLIRSPQALKASVDWQTYFGLGAGIWFLVVVIRWPKEEGKRLRRLLLLLALFVLLSDGSRLVLHWGRASEESWRLAGGFLNYTDLLVWGGMIALISGWLKEKVRLVGDPSGQKDSH